MYLILTYNKKLIALYYKICIPYFHNLVMATCGFFAEPWVYKDGKPLPGAVYLDSATAWVRVSFSVPYGSDKVIVKVLPIPETHTIQYLARSKREVFDIKLHIMPVVRQHTVRLKLDVTGTENNMWAEYIMAGTRTFVCQPANTWSIEGSQLVFPPPLDDIISGKKMPCDGPVYFTYKDGTDIKLCDPPMCEFPRYHIRINKTDVEEAMRYLGYI